MFLCSVLIFFASLSFSCPPSLSLQSPLALFGVLSLWFCRFGLKLSASIVYIGKVLALSQNTFRRHCWMTKTRCDHLRKIKEKKNQRKSETKTKMPNFIWKSSYAPVKSKPIVIAHDSPSFFFSLLRFSRFLFFPLLCSFSHDSSYFNVYFHSVLNYIFFCSFAKETLWPGRVPQMMLHH